MLIKKALHIAALSVGIAVPAQAMNAQLEKVVNYLQELDAKKVENDFIKVIKQLEPTGRDLVAKIQSGDYDDLADILAVDLTPAIIFLHNNMDALKGTLATGLPAALDKIRGSLPENYRGQVQRAVDTAVDNLGVLSSLKSKLSDLKGYGNLKEYKKTIATALKAIAESPEADKLVQILNELQAELRPLASIVSTIDMNKVRNAINTAKDIVEKRIKGVKIAIRDLTPIAEFVNELRTKLAPAIPLAASTISNYAVRINDLAKQAASKYGASLSVLPPEVFNAAQFIHSRVGDLKISIEKLNDIIDEAKSVGRSALGINE